MSNTFGACRRNSRAFFIQLSGVDTHRHAYICTTELHEISRSILMMTNQTNCTAHVLLKFVFEFVTQVPRISNAFRIFFSSPISTFAANREYYCHYTESLRYMLLLMLLLLLQMHECVCVRNWRVFELMIRRERKKKRWRNEHAWNTCVERAIVSHLRSKLGWFSHLRIHKSNPFSASVGYLF